MPAILPWSMALMPVGVSMPLCCICNISCWCLACIAASPRLSSCNNWPLLTSTKRTVSPALMSMALGVKDMSSITTSMLRVALAAGAG
ncbi:hypothetical protein D3C76_1602210 [compost metagenome]